MSDESLVDQAASAEPAEEATEGSSATEAAPPPRRWAPARGAALSVIWWPEHDEVAAGD